MLSRSQPSGYIGGLLASHPQRKQGQHSHQKPIGPAWENSGHSALESGQRFSAPAGVRSILCFISACWVLLIRGSPASRELRHRYQKAQNPARAMNELVQGARTSRTVIRFDGSGMELGHCFWQRAGVCSSTRKGVGFLWPIRKLKGARIRGATVRRQKAASIVALIVRGPRIGHPSRATADMRSVPPPK